MADNQHRTGTGLTGLALAALGVVFGDIGTSPLYAFRESLRGGLDVSEANVLGVLSLIFWALFIVITTKYVLLVMRADNHGEGGILALAALVPPRGRGSRIMVLLGIFGTALLYGDGMITPAISVVSAVEGVEIAAAEISSWVLPIAAVILVAVFTIQRHGTAAVGKMFGPVMVVWFFTLTVLGAVQVIGEPEVLRAVNPMYAAAFFADNGLRGMLVLGSVFLVVTGGEALYADMGHFGRRPIQVGWFTLVLPALVVNYMGQGALLLGDPTAIENPFYLLAPGWAQLPLIVLATGATIIASQALISGAFSLTVQAVNLGYLPRMRVVQTSELHRGQVYVPFVNWLLLGACLVLVYTFRSSTNLAAAYGVAVTLTMVITTVLLISVVRQRWRWSLVRTLTVIVPLLVVDAAFAVANLAKIPTGGWVPLAIGLVGFAIITTWRTGRRLLDRYVERRSLTVADFVASLAKHPPTRHPGTGVYLHREPSLVPPTLLANLRHNESLHETIVFLSVTTDERAHVNPAERDRVIEHDLGFVELELRYGFADRPDLASDLQELLLDAASFDPEHTTFFLGRERIGVTERPGMAKWREHLFAVLHRNAGDPTTHFGLPPARTVDIGIHVDI